MDAAGRRKNLRIRARVGLLTDTSASYSLNHKAWLVLAVYFFVPALFFGPERRFRADGRWASFKLV
jgi:hypothetical protein